jgi:hypothetical protein
MSVLSWLKPATLAVTVVAAGSLLAPAPVQAQVTVLRGSPSLPSPPYSSNQDNNQDNQSSTYSPSSYDDTYPYYGDDFPLGVGDLGRGFHRGDSLHRGFHGGFHRGDFIHRGFRTGGFHAGFHGGGFHGGGFHGGGFHGGGAHGGGGHR